MQPVERAAAAGDVTAKYLWGITLSGMSKTHDAELAAMAHEWGEAHGLEPRWWDTLRENGERSEARGTAYVKEAAEAGLVAAQRTFGAMLMQGVGGEEAPDEAVLWMRRAAEQGDLRAQVNLAQFLAQGQGVEADPEEAVDWYRRAVWGGGEEAEERQEELTGWDRIVLKDVPAQAKALTDWGRLEWYGRGIPQDKPAAVEKIRKAAELGNRRGKGMWAMTLAKGEWVEQDLEEAACWYEQAAREGEHVSQNELAGMYANGEGVEEDQERATHLYRAAAEGGLPEGQYNLAQRLAVGLGAEEDRVEALHWLHKAAESGQAEACCDLALCYLAGEGVDQDEALGEKLLRKAEAGGSERARQIRKMRKQEAKSREAAKDRGRVWRKGDDLWVQGPDKMVVLFGRGDEEERARKQGIAVADDRGVVLTVGPEQRKEGREGRRRRRGWFGKGRKTNGTPPVH